MEAKEVYLKKLQGLCNSTGLDEESINIVELRKMFMVRSAGLCRIRAFVKRDGSLMRVNEICADPLAVKCLDLKDLERPYEFYMNYVILSQRLQMKESAYRQSHDSKHCRLNQNMHHRIQTLKSDTLASFRRELMFVPGLDIRAVHIFRWDGNPRPIQEIQWALCHYSTSGVSPAKRLLTETYRQRPGTSILARLDLPTHEIPHIAAAKCEDTYVVLVGEDHTQSTPKFLETFFSHIGSQKYADSVVLFESTWSEDAIKSRDKLQYSPDMFADICNELSRLNMNCTPVTSFQVLLTKRNSAILNGITIKAFDFRSQEVAEALTEAEEEVFTLKYATNLKTLWRKHKSFLRRTTVEVISSDLLNKIDAMIDIYVKELSQAEPRYDFLMTTIDNIDVTHDSLADYGLLYHVKDACRAKKRYVFAFVGAMHMPNMQRILIDEFNCRFEERVTDKSLTKYPTFQVDRTSLWKRWTAWISSFWN